MKIRSIQFSCLFLNWMWWFNFCYLGRPFPCFGYCFIFSSCIIL